MFTFLRTYKKILKRFWKTNNYSDVRYLVTQIIFYHRKIVPLLNNQNKLLYNASKERDALQMHIADMQPVYQAAYYWRNKYDNLEIEYSSFKKKNRKYKYIMMISIIIIMAIEIWRLV